VELFSEKPTAMIFPSGWRSSAWAASLPWIVVVRVPLIEGAVGVEPDQRAIGRRAHVRQDLPAEQDLSVGLDQHGAGALRTPIAVRRPRLTSPVRWREVRTAAPPVGDLDLPGVPC
jgi:hypothetical protein